MKFKFLLFVVAAFGMFGYAALEAGAVSPNILINVAPPNPAPYENTIITLKSYVNNLDSILISWSLNGKIASSGIGKKSFSATAPAAGEEITIIATISLPDRTEEAKIIIKPSVMILLWQANDSYVPPFYRGKAMPSLGSEIKVVAMPEIKGGSGLIPSQNMTYYWKKDYTNSVDGSGYGKNFFIYTNDYLEDLNTISVEARTVDQQSSATASITVEATEPKILFYKKDAGLGTIWQRSLANPHIIQGGETVEAIPYFISPKEIQSPILVWSWFINDNRVSLESSRKNLMPLQAEAGAHGTSQLRLEIENREKIFQSMNKEINIEF